MTIFRNEEEK